MGKGSACKIAVYYEHANTLGHSISIWALLKSLHQHIPRSQILLLEGGRTPLGLGMQEYAQVVPIPYSFDRKGAVIDIGQRIRRSSSVEQMCAERQKVMVASLNKFRPDIFLVEHFPFGRSPWSFTLPALLSHARHKLGAQVCASAIFLNYVEGIYENIDRHFDRIFVHTPQELSFTYVDWLAKAESLAMSRVLCAFHDRIDFTGFLFQKPVVRGVSSLRRQLLVSGFQRIVLVSRGGGIFDNNEIIVSALLLARRKKTWFFVVCCGPSTSVGDLANYQKLAQGLSNVFLTHSLSPEMFDRYLMAADLCVNTSGYSTAAKLLYLRKRAVLVPYKNSEQQWRAASLLKLIPSVCLPDKELTVDRLCRAMTTVLRKPVPEKEFPRTWFEGACGSARRLLR